MDAAAYKEQLEKEGFRHIYEWTDEADVEYPTHAHKDKVCMYIVSGSITIYFDNDIVELNPGDRFDVPPGAMHTADVGPDGCSCVVGEMIPGDS